MPTRGRQKGGECGFNRRFWFLFGSAGGSCWLLVGHPSSVDGESRFFAQQLHLSMRMRVIRDTAGLGIHSVGARPVCSKPGEEASNRRVGTSVLVAHTHLGAPGFGVTGMRSWVELT